MTQITLLHNAQITQIAKNAFLRRLRGLYLITQIGNFEHGWEFTVYCLPFRVYSLRFTVYRLRFIVYRLQFTVYCLPFTVYRLLFTVYGVEIYLLVFFG